MNPDPLNCFKHKGRTYKTNVMDRHRFDADPDPDLTFYFNVDPDPDHSLKLSGMQFY